MCEAPSLEYDPDLNSSQRIQERLKELSDNNIENWETQELMDLAEFKSHEKMILGQKSLRVSPKP